MAYPSTSPLGYVQDSCVFTLLLYVLLLNNCIFLGIFKPSRVEAQFLSAAIVSMQERMYKSHMTVVITRSSSPGISQDILCLGLALCFT